MYFSSKYNSTPYIYLKQLEKIDGELFQLQPLSVALLSTSGSDVFNSRRPRIMHCALPCVPSRYVPSAPCYTKTIIPDIPSCTVIPTWRIGSEWPVGVWWVTWAPRQAHWRRWVPGWPRWWCCWDLHTGGCRFGGWWRWRWVGIGCSVNVKRRREIFAGRVEGSARVICGVLIWSYRVGDNLEDL